MIYDLRKGNADLEFNYKPNCGYEYFQAKFFHLEVTNQKLFTFRFTLDVGGKAGSNKKMDQEFFHENHKELLSIVITDPKIIDSLHEKCITHKKDSKLWRLQIISKGIDFDYDATVNFDEEINRLTFDVSSS